MDITSQPPSPEQLAEALRQLGGRSRLLNTSGASYRALGAERVRAMSDAEVLEALAADGRLIKRPFLVMDDGTILTGFRPEEWEPLFPPQPSL
jgi:arsenate reductase